MQRAQRPSALVFASRRPSRRRGRQATQTCSRASSQISSTTPCATTSTVAARSGHRDPCLPAVLSRRQHRAAGAIGGCRPPLRALPPGRRTIAPAPGRTRARPVDRSRRCRCSRRYPHCRATIRRRVASRGGLPDSRCAGRVATHRSGLRVLELSHPSHPDFESRLADTRPHFAGLNRTSPTSSRPACLWQEPLPVPVITPMVFWLM